MPDARIIRLSDAESRQPAAARDEPAAPVRVVRPDERGPEVVDAPSVQGGQPSEGPAQAGWDGGASAQAGSARTGEGRGPGEDESVEGRGDEAIDLTEAAMRRAEARRESDPDGAQVARDWAEALAALEDAAAGLARTAGGDGLGPLGSTEFPDWERKLAGALAFLRRRITGDYEVDEFGFDPDLTEHVLATALRPLYERWFRVETRGMENLPDEGSALVVANHSGTVPLDAMMTTLAVYDHHPMQRHLRMLGADLVFQIPFLAPLARKAGNTLACQADAERLLSTGQLVGVWPEGFKGIGKPYSERYKLQRFGRGGFVASALRTGAPIIPCSIVGAEEIYPMIGNLKTLARLFGLPYLPVTPTFPLLGPLGLVPLPSKWIIEFGEPVETASYGAAAADDPMTVFNLTDQVRETIQSTLYKLLMQRRSVFF